MPLREDDVERAFVQVSEEDTVADALEKLRHQCGNDQWYVVVAQGEETFGVIKVGALRAMLEQVGPALFEMPFAELGERLTEPETRDQRSVGIGMAERLALRSSAGLMIATDEDRVEGYVRGLTKRGGEIFPGSSMGQLYGDYISQDADARADWEPAGVEEPICPACGYEGFYTYDAARAAFVCKSCGQPAPEVG